MPKDEKIPTATPVAIPGMIFACLLVLAAAAVAAFFAVLRFIPQLLLGPQDREPSAVITAMPSFDPSAFLMGGILIMLIGIFGLLALAIVLCCGCKGGLPLPTLPSLPKIANVLRTVAAVLDQGANGISTANDAVDPARQALIGMADITIPVPKFRSIGNFNLGIYSGEVWVPDGLEHKSLMSLIDDTTEQKLEDFANDASGKTVLSNASTTLRQQADILESQADTLETMGS